MMEYKGYFGTAEFDDEADIFHGEVLLTRGVVTFQGRTVTELKKAFRDSIDDYLEFCKEQNISPEKPFSGKFVLRLTPEEHRMASLAAKTTKKSLNAWAAEQIKIAAFREGFGCQVLDSSKACAKPASKAKKLSESHSNKT